MPRATGTDPRGSKLLPVTNPQNRAFIRPPRCCEGRMRRRVLVGSVGGDFENPVDVDQVGVGQGAAVGLGAPRLPIVRMPGGVCRWRLSKKPRSGPLQSGSHEPDRKRCLLHFHEPIDHFGSTFTLGRRRPRPSRSGPCRALTQPRGARQRKLRPRSNGGQWRRLSR